MSAAVSHYASMVQKKAMELAQAGFGTRFKTYRHTPMLQVSPSDLPLLAIHILREKRTPWGDANHAAPKFQHDILLTNARFVMLTDGIEGMDRQSQYAKVGETTLYEIRVELVFSFQSDFPPKVEDILETVHVTTQYPDKAHVDSGTPQIEREYDLETS